MAAFGGNEIKTCEEDRDCVLEHIKLYFLREEQGQSETWGLL